MNTLYITIFGPNPQGEQIYLLTEDQGNFLGVNTRKGVNKFVTQNRYKYNEILDEELLNLRIAQLEMEIRRLK